MSKKFYRPCEKKPAFGMKTLKSKAAERLRKNAEWNKVNKRSKKQD